MVLAATTYGVAQSIHRLPFRGVKLALLFAAALGLAIAAQHATSLPGGWALKLGAAALFAGLAWSSGVGRER